nr:MAG TPA: hypothetical protein [Caudoviricetes sp.]
MSVTLLNEIIDIKRGLCQFPPLELREALGAFLSFYLFLLFIRYS